MFELIGAILAWSLACSLLSISQYAIDKRQAGIAGPRIRERTLLLTALAGGWPGALIGQRLFRHKTRKQPYKARLWLAIAFHLLLVALVIWAVWRWHIKG
jgi:uncharacterized membrane protein YsdA (DUF1294 family)